MSLHNSSLTFMTNLGSLSPFLQKIINNTKLERKTQKEV